MINYEGMAFPKKARIKDKKAMKNKNGHIKKQWLEAIKTGGDFDEYNR